MIDDHWTSATAYDRFMGRWSRHLAAEFVSWLDVEEGGSWLEIGCGTGSLTRAIFDRAHPGSVTAVDPAADFVTYCATHLRNPGLSVVQATTESLPAREGGYRAVVSSLVLNFLPDPVTGLLKMAEACSPQGCVAACVWDYGEGMEFLRLFWDAATDVDPDAAPHDERTRFPLCRPDALRSAFQRAGLRAIDVTSLTIPTAFTDFDDYWSSFSLGTGPAPSYLASLSEARRDALRDRLRVLTHAGSGTALHLQARAWAIRGLPGSR